MSGKRKDNDAPPEDADSTEDGQGGTPLTDHPTKILDKIPHGVYTLDEDFVITSVNEAVTLITGYAREELIGRHSTILAGEETLAMADEILAHLREDSGRVGLIQTDLETADGSTIPVETWFSTLELDDGSTRRVGVLRDASEQVQYERMLKALNSSARRLLRATGRSDVCEILVEVLGSVWPDADSAVYLYEGSETTLQPSAWKGLDPAPKGVGTAEWEAFTSGDQRIDLSGIPDPETSGEDRSFRQPAQGTDTNGENDPSGRVLEPDRESDLPERRLFVTLDEYGVLVIELPTRSVAPDVTEPAELLAANAVAAFERVERESELSTQRDALAERTDRLEQLHEFNELLRLINRALVEADTLGEITQTVCDHLVSAETVSFAWIGEQYRTHEELREIARSGDAHDRYLHDLKALILDSEDPSPSEGSEPTARALASGRTVTVDDTSVEFREHSWRKRAFSSGIQSVISVPLAYKNLEYGVLSVYSDQTNTFAGEFGDLLSELGTTIAKAINDIETKRSLRSESTVEIDLCVEDPDALLSTLSTELDEPIAIDGVIPRGDGRSIVYLSTRGDPGELTSLVAVESVRRLGDGGDASVEVTVTRPPINERLADYGANVEELAVDGDVIRTTLTLPLSADIRTLIEQLQGDYRSAELVARRERDPAGKSTNQVSSVEDRLTDRQLEAVRTAYLNGYFNWPRTNTGEEVAEALGITQPTFNRHLRTVERELFSSLFATDTSSETDAG